MKIRFHLGKKKYLPFPMEMCKKTSENLFLYEVSEESVIKNNERRNMSFYLGHYFILLSKCDEKNYANPCICPEL